MLTHIAVNNDFHESKTLFELFRGLEVKDLEKPVEPAVVTNGDHIAHGEGELPASEVDKEAVKAAKTHAVVMAQ